MALYNLGDAGWKCSLLVSISASSTELQKEFRDFGAHKSLQLVGQVAKFKFNSKFQPLPVIWQLLPQAIPEKTIAELFGQRSGKAWAGWTGEHKHRELQSWWKLFNCCWQQQVRFTKKTNN